MKYSKKLAANICAMISTGDHTIIDICKKNNISKETFYHWRETKTDFSDLLKKANQDYLDSIKIEARSGLKVLLTKHEYEEVTTDYTEGKPGPNGESKPKIKSVKLVKKFVMPNVAAVIYALNNSDKETFKQRQLIEHTGKDDGPMETELTIKVGYGNKEEDEDPDAKY